VFATIFKGDLPIVNFHSIRRKTVQWFCILGKEQDLLIYSSIKCPITRKR